VKIYSIRFFELEHGVNIYMSIIGSLFLCALQNTVKHLIRHIAEHEELWGLFVLAPGFLAIDLVFQHQRKVGGWSFVKSSVFPIKQSCIFLRPVCTMQAAFIKYKDY